jgi:tRNA-dihydrouridine synthase
VAAVKAAVRIPVIVNGDVRDLVSAKAALQESGADGVMLGRGVYGRPWLAAALDRGLAGDAVREPDLATRLDIALDHFSDSLAFYGDALGLKMFKKHLGHYVEAAPWPETPEARRVAKSVLCRLDDPIAVERGLTALWNSAVLKAAA